ncbi:MAG TPA: hypothetical protein VMB19_03320 [Silvibacterium sp.]|nr:hypothetical protein [Silvibacterium sp.]
MTTRTIAWTTVLSAALLFASAQAHSPGPIRLDPNNPHYFLFRGKTIALVTSGEHYGAVLNADFDYRRYLDTLQSAGLNYTRLFPGSYVEVPAKSFGIRRNDLAPEEGKFLAPWARSSTPGYGGGGNKLDLDRWSPDYFARLHDFLNEASKRGIVVEISLFSSQYGEAQWDLSPFNPANNVSHTTAIDWKKVNTLDNGNISEYQEQYTRKLIREVNGFDNVIFELQNEPFADRSVLDGVVNPYLFPPARNQFPNTIETADGASLAWQVRVAEWITREEASLPNRHLIAQNYCDFGLPVSRLIPGVNMVNFHYAYPEAASANYGIGKLLAYDETGFLGQDDAAYRREAWNFMLSGGGAFDGLDYSFSVGHEDGSDTAPNGPGGGSPPLRRQLGILSKFLESLPLAEMAPDYKTVKHAGAAYARVLSSPGKLYAIYLDGNGPADLILDLPSGNYSAEWIDPESGATTKTEAIRDGGGEKLLQSPLFKNGIALKLTRTTAP